MVRRTIKSQFFNDSLNLRRSIKTCRNISWRDIVAVVRLGTDFDFDTPHIPAFLKADLTADADGVPDRDVQCDSECELYAVLYPIAKLSLEGSDLQLPMRT
jgi:hypothetical protein